MAKQIEKYVDGVRILNMGGDCNGCYGCPYAPTSFEEYVIAQNGGSGYCKDAFASVSKHCGKYNSEYEFTD